MVSRAFKLRFRRRLRLRRRQVEAIGQQAEAQLEQNFFRRLERLNNVRRFILGWATLLILLGTCLVVQIRALNGYYQTLQPKPGGTYTEGIVGSFSNANPVYASGTVDQAVSRLLFSSLYTYNDKNQLVGDLASGPWDVNNAGTVYTVHLRPGLTWQDGQPLTSADVLFTYQVIQSPDAQSPLNSSWQGAAIAAPDPLTVTFTLPDPLSSFPYSLTNGIIPKHILGGTAMADMRSATFNTSDPVGSGPFQWQGIQVTGDSPQTREEQIALKPFAAYHAGKPKLDGFVVRSFHAQDTMIASFQKHEINGMAGLDSLPSSLKNDASIRTYDLPLTAAVMSFFRVGDGALADTRVRQALVQAADTQTIIQSLGYPALAVREPLLQGQLAYDPTYAQASFDIAAAKAQLGSAGWHVGANGIREKAGQPLQFRLTTQDSPEYTHVASLLQAQWKAVGVDVKIVAQDPTDLQSTLASHGYDVLLYGIAIGTDPDVSAYWNSSQGNVLSATRLNFSEYHSATADASLEAGRTRQDPALRTIKYRPFLQAWQNDAPALGLYQPRVFYVTRGELFGLSEHTVNNATDRYDNVNNWMVRETPVSQTPSATKPTTK